MINVRTPCNVIQYTFELGAWDTCIRNLFKATLNLKKLEITYQLEYEALRLDKIERRFLYYEFTYLHIHAIFNSIKWYLSKG